MALSHVATASGSFLTALDARVNYEKGLLLEDPGLLVKAMHDAHLSGYQAFMELAPVSVPSLLNAERSLSCCFISGWREAEYFEEKASCPGCQNLDGYPCQDHI